MPGKYDGRYSRRKICEKIGIPAKEYVAFIVEKYKNGMSGNEISEWINETTGFEMNARSIQRIVKKAQESRTIGDAFRNAIKRGRVNCQATEYKIWRGGNKTQLSRADRYRIMKRDKFRCMLCGFGKREGVLLQIDHKVARVHGGSNADVNLQTLCIDCNVGKRQVEKENGRGGMRFVGGKRDGGGS